MRVREYGTKWLTRYCMHALGARARLRRGWVGVTVRLCDTVTDSSVPSTECRIEIR